MAVFPLMIASGVIHWSTSQTIFLVRFEIPDLSESGFSGPQFRVGFSILGIMVTIGMGTIMLVVVILVSFMKWYPNNVPFVGGCSVVLSAACHSHKANKEDREKIVLQPLSWGDIGIVDTDTGLRHLCFSDEEVSPLIKCARYAGIKSNDDNELSLS